MGWGGERWDGVVLQLRNGEWTSEDLAGWGGVIGVDVL